MSLQCVRSVWRKPRWRCFIDRWPTFFAMQIVSLSRNPCYNRKNRDLKYPCYYRFPVITGPVISVFHCTRFSISLVLSNSNYKLTQQLLSLTSFSNLCKKIDAAHFLTTLSDEKPISYLEWSDRSALSSCFGQFFLQMFVKGLTHSFYRPFWNKN